MIEVRFTLPFIRRLKPLTKRYRKIQSDIQPAIEQLQNGHLIGEQISGLDFTIFKVRAKNSDIPIGKSGGYRLIYQVVSPLPATPRSPHLDSPYHLAMTQSDKGDRVILRLP